MTFHLPGMDNLFRLMFEEVPCYGSILDADLNLVAVNRLCRESFATPFTRRCFQVFKGRSEICAGCPAKTTFQDGRISESDEQLTLRSGQEVHVVCRTVPIRDDDGKITAVLHLSVHSGQAEKLQQDLTAVDSQIRAVSHGIKGLLTAMAGGFYLWDSGLSGSKAERLQQGVEIVRRNFQRIQHFAHDVLYYVRDRTLHPESLDGVDILKELVEDLQEEGGFFGMRILLDEAPTPVPLKADRRALLSALANLVVSSIEDCYGDKEHMVHEVRLSVREEGGFALFEVADNGAGMDPKDLEKVFSLFFNPKGIEASGVGLYITNKLVRAHGGSMDIESKPGKGTRYMMRIPTRE